MYNYSLSLALFDFFPVILSGLGWYWLSHWVALKAPEYRRILIVGATLVVLGGLSKVSWKLIIALSGTAIEFLNNNLFLLMTPGFALIVASIWRATPGAVSRPARDPLIYGGLALTLLIPIVIALSTDHPRGWFLALVGLTTLFNCLIIGRLFFYCWPRSQRLTACLFAFNLLAAFILSALARTGDQSEAIQWLEEIINTGAQGALAFAAYRLTQEEQKRSSL